MTLPAHMMMKTSVRFRLTLWYVGSICFLVVVFFAYTFFNFSHAIYGSDVIGRFDQELTRYAETVARRAGQVPGPFYTPVERYTAQFNSWIGDDLFLKAAYGQICDIPAVGASPVLSIRNDALENREIPLSESARAALAQDKSHIETVHLVFPFPLRVITMKIHDSIGQLYILQVGMSMSHINTTLGNVLKRFLLTWPVVMAVISLMGYLFVRKSLAPVHRLVEETRSITAQDLSRRIPEDGAMDEIGQLTRTLNEMIGRLEESFNAVLQFSGDAAHEMRTPLTVMRGEIEVALRHDRSPGEYRSILESILQETEQLGSIIDNLLLLSRMDTRSDSFIFGDGSLDRIIMESYEEVLPIAAEKGVSISIDSLEEVNTRCEAGLLKRLFVNLMHNAVKYTPPGGTVTCRLDLNPSAGSIRFTIRDTGVGIPRRNLPRIFDRFYRVDPSRSARTGGKGLGLTIVKKILDLHGGTISVESTPGAGTVFTLDFPSV